MNFKPTLEQQAIIKEAQVVDRLKIDAAAGASKTTTLTMVANAIQKPSIYLAFNKAIALEAQQKFPDHVECRTTHSLAFASFGTTIAHKLNRPQGRYLNVAGTSLEIAKYYRLQQMKSEDKVVTSTNLGLLVKETVKRFESSSDSKLGRNHISWREMKKLFPNDIERNRAISLIEKIAKRLWEERIDPHSDVLATHNTYLKLFQMSKPKLDYDVIYIDEAQDSADVVLDIFLNQTHAKLIAVGDNYQAIYGWNGAVNAMQKLKFPRKTLTKSFRFGQEIADVATAIIRGGIDVRGFEKINSKVTMVDQDKPYTAIFRTNGALLEEAVRLSAKGITLSVEIDTKDFIKLLDSALALYNKDMKKVKHDSVIPYGSWEEYSEAKEDDPEIRRVVSIIMSGRAGLFCSTLKGVKKNDNAHVTLTTCHKSKGREWKQVLLADDFKQVTEGTSQEELNLLYVAVTRAQETLEINDAVDDALDYWDEIKDI